MSVWVGFALILRGYCDILRIIMASKTQKNIVIIGAGFAGISCAMRLARLLPDDTITLISNKDYFEYYPALYRVATGSSPLQACVMLSDIFERYPQISVVEDTIIDIDPTGKTVTGREGKYTADYLVITVGSENSFFNIEGVAEFSFNFKSIHQAIRLRNRIEELFKLSVHVSPEEQLLNLRFVVVGGGPSGVELAGELAQYTKDLAKKYAIDESFITIDLVEAGPRLLGRMDTKISHKATQRLREIGVNIFANRILTKDESWTVFLRDMKLASKTVIWAAGVQNNILFKSVENFEYDGRGLVVVDDYLQATGFENIFIGGDNARTQYSGMAQTAIYDGNYIAETIYAKMKSRALKKYIPHPVSYDIPVGPGWAVLQHAGITLYGRLAWWMRHIIDLRFYLSILPMRKALRAFFSGKKNISHNS